MQRVDGGTRNPLTLISAPAGSGKTTLLAEWLAVGDHPGEVVRLSLGPEAEGPRAFWGVVAAAVPGFAAFDERPGYGARVLDSLSARDEPLVLVLDDFNGVGSQEVAEELDWLLEHGGELVRLVIATRSDPPMRLERLRMAGRMTEVRAIDLAFTLPEAAELLGDLGMSEADLELLWGRTDGWVGGLRLAQLSIEGREDAHEFVVSFAGDDRTVSDYLMSEVVDRQEPDTVDFLLRACVADKLSAELADVLTEGHDGQQRLRTLERGFGLAKALDSRGHWYSLHPLLREVLRAESRRRLPAEQGRLHGLAAHWYAGQGSTFDALRHAVEAADWGLAGEVVGAHWMVCVTRGSGPGLLELAERIPDEVVRADAELALAKAGLLLEAGDDPAADGLLVDAYSLAPRLSGRRARRFAVTATATDLYRARLRGDVEQAISAAQVALAEDWGRDLAVEVRALTLANLGIAELWAGAQEDAGNHLQQAVGLALESGNDFVLFLAESYAAAVDANAGRLDEASARAELALELAERHGWTQVAHVAMAHSALASVHLWRGDLEGTAASVERAHAAVADSREPLLRPCVGVMRSAVLALRGEPARALDALRGATAHGPMPRLLEVSSGLLEAQLWLALGEPDRARRILGGLERSSPDGANALAQVQLAEGDPAGAVRTIEAFLADEREALIPFARVEARVLEAIARDAMRDEAAALEALERALDMAEPRGCSVVVVRYGAPVRSLLRRLVARGTRHRALADDFIARLGGGGEVERSVTSPLLEPLSDRELTVLRYLPTMMSNAEIAAEMFVSVNTVKTHLKHVYRKLDVTDRRDCVRRGRELRLLSPGISEG